jgi:glycerol kinase
MGTVDSFLIWNLTGGERHLTDYTNASRTLLFNVGRGRWDDTLADLFDVPPALLPRSQPSRSSFGATDPDFFGTAVPIMAVAGAELAALAGQACFAPGQASATYDETTVVLAPAGARPVYSENGLLLGIGANAGPAGPEYVLEGPASSATAALDWLCELGAVRRVEDVEALAASTAGSGGLTLVPAFEGLEAPDWDPFARGAMLGIARGTSRAQVVRATLDGIALATADLIAAIDADLPAPVRELRVDGVAAGINCLLQLIADYSGVPVARPAQLETVGLGAACLAGLSAGIWQSIDEIREMWKPARVFEPQLGADERGEALLRWRRAIQRAAGWARND